MSEDRASQGEKFVRRFLSHTYDEWITGIDDAEFPSVNALTCRALSAAIGSESFKKVLQSLIADQRIAALCSYENAEPNAASIKLLDYSV